MELETLGDRYKRVENIIEEDSPGEVLQLFIERIKILEDVVDECEDLVALTNDLFKRDNQIAKKHLEAIAKGAKTLKKNFEGHLKSIKKSESFVFIVNQIAPRLIMKLESVTEKLEDIVENINLSLKFQKEFSKIVPLALEYAKKASTTDLDEKINKS
jgi:hypothetical protein